MSPQQTEILVTILQLVVASGLVGAALKVAVGYLTQRLGPERARVALTIAEAAVRAVEQVAAVRGWNSATKYARALEAARAVAEAHHIALSDAQWRTLIEAGVQLINETQGALLPAVEVSGESASVNVQAPPQPEAPAFDPSDPQVIARVLQAVSAALAAPSAPASASEPAPVIVAPSATPAASPTS